VGGGRRRWSGGSIQNEYPTCRRLGKTIKNIIKHKKTQKNMIWRSKA